MGCTQTPFDAAPVSSLAGCSSTTPVIGVCLRRDLSHPFFADPSSGIFSFHLALKSFKFAIASDRYFKR
jgi:hypothetical protein